MNKYSLKRFEPEKVAAIEVAMWQNYYNHAFVKLLFDLRKLMGTQFGLRGFKLFQAAYFSTTAALVFRKTAHQVNTVKQLIKFFSVIRESSLEQFNVNEVARLEFDWWKKHRSIDYMKEKTLEGTLADAMAALYLIESVKLEHYARYRAEAMRLRDEAAHRSNKEPDWDKIGELLGLSYQALKKAVQ